MKEARVESQPVSQTRRILYILLAIAIVLIIVAAGILVGRQLAGGKDSAETVVVPSPAVEIVQPTATPVPVQPTPTTARVAVPGGQVDASTGIAVLPAVQLAGNRRYVLRVSSAAGAVAFSGSYSRSSIDPKVAVDAMEEIKGQTPWEQEIAPPAPGARTWTLGVTAGTNPVGKDLQISVWDAGPK
jgi:hypothetical protein